LKAIEFKTTGNLDHLQYVEMEEPKIQPHEVFIKVLAAGLNKSDTTNVMGLFPYTTVPRVPGRDYSGVIEKGPKDLLGIEVFGTGKEIGFTQNGAHAQYLCLDANAICIKPKEISHQQAASLGVPYITAYFAVENTRIQKDSKVVIIGASGAVGFAASLLAKQKGANVLCILRNEAKAHSLEQLGLKTELINQDSQLETLVTKHFKGGADVVFDTTGIWISQSISALATYGRLACIVVPGDGNVKVSIRDLYRVGGEIIGVNSLLYSAKQCAQVFNKLLPGFKNGDLLSSPDLAFHPLSEAPTLYKKLRGGETGKIILLPHS
jgi:NADPH:quinone reductase-like Zn-dependent oxidoreductase